MTVQALGYVGVRAEGVEDWSSYATGLLGLQRVDKSRNTRAFRMDDRVQRLLVSDEPGETLAFLGFEVAHRDDLQTYAARLDAAGVRVHQGARELADRRFVGDLIWFEDPAGNRVELTHAPMIASDPFVPGRPIDGFNTGPLGMGHAVLHVKDIEVMMPFYRGRRADTPSTFRALKFHTYVAPSLLDPDVPALKIDYDLPSNPALSIRRVLDELVDLADGYFFGRAYVRWWWGSWQRVAYFSLRMSTD